jgi:hypothetical protein
MSATQHQKFLVLYQIPVDVMDAWAKTDPATRKPAEEKMQAEWRQWSADHTTMIQRSEAAGKTRRVTAGGTSDARNDIMLYSFVEAESHEAAAKAFENHPHLQIPQAFIDIMCVRPIGEM